LNGRFDAVDAPSSERKDMRSRADITGNLFQNSARRQRKKLEKKAFGQSTLGLHRRAKVPACHVAGSFAAGSRIDSSHDARRAAALDRKAAARNLAQFGYLAEASRMSP
jgi:hypothetical protein